MGGANGRAPGAWHLLCSACEWACNYCTSDTALRVPNCSVSSIIMHAGQGQVRRAGSRPGCIPHPAAGDRGAEERSRLSYLFYVLHALQQQDQLHAPCMMREVPHRTESLNLAHAMMGSPCPGPNYILTVLVAHPTGAPEGAGAAGF